MTLNDYAYGGATKSRNVHIYEHLNLTISDSIIFTIFHSAIMDYTINHCSIDNLHCAL